MMTPHAAHLADLFALSGKVAIVTGAGSGIGTGIAHCLASAGAHVALADCNLAAAEAVAAEIASSGGKAFAVEVDIAEEASVASMIEKIIAACGAVDILVNNAGLQPRRFLADMTVSEWDRIHAVNSRGTFLCIREAAKTMVSAGNGGRIVNIASIGALHPLSAGLTAYNASKAGVVMLTKTAALELAPAQVRVNAVLPGGVSTPGSRQTLIDSSPISGGALRSPPLGERGTPEDIAAAVLFFASKASRHITGQALVVDGGFLLT